MKSLREQIIPADGGDLRPVPFPRAQRTPKAPLYQQVSIDRMLSRPPVLEEVDPTLLWATQRCITTPGVHYYLTGEYAWTGRTYADFDNKANRYPLIYRRFHPRTGDDQFVILAGHHRSTAALIEHRPVLARVIDGRTAGTDVAACRRAIVITPSLWLATRQPHPAPTGVTTVSTVDDARTHLATRGLTTTDIDERIRFARIGSA